ncbi:unnamed protein product [Linum trigynum]|uniref:Uncharacterized protein n=1 Tax=Linum trigynum TaxID=586398 RepID=A0AAV2CJG8_9ROSI
MSPLFPCDIPCLDHVNVLSCTSHNIEIGKDPVQQTLFTILLSIRDFFVTLLPDMPQDDPKINPLLFILRVFDNPAIRDSDGMSKLPPKSFSFLHCLRRCSVVSWLLHPGCLQLPSFVSFLRALSWLVSSLSCNVSQRKCLILFGPFHFQSFLHSSSSVGSSSSAASLYADLSLNLPSGSSPQRVLSSPCPSFGVSAPAIKDRTFSGSFPCNRSQFQSPERVTKLHTGAHGPIFEAKVWSLFNREDEEVIGN